MKKGLCNTCACNCFSFKLEAMVKMLLSHYRRLRNAILYNTFASYSTNINVNCARMRTLNLVKILALKIYFRGRLRILFWYVKIGRSICGMFFIIRRKKHCSGVASIRNFEGWYTWVHSTGDIVECRGYKFALLQRYWKWTERNEKLFLHCLTLLSALIELSSSGDSRCQIFSVGCLWRPETSHVKNEVTGLKSITCITHHQFLSFLSSKYSSLCWNLNTSLLARITVTNAKLVAFSFGKITDFLIMNVR